MKDWDSLRKTIEKLEKEIRQLKGRVTKLEKAHKEKE